MRKKKNTKIGKEQETDMGVEGGRMRSLKGSMAEREVALGNQEPRARDLDGKVKLDV